jgi:hypothetical protein
MINTVDTPETDSQITTFTSISKYGKHFENRTGTVSAEFARKLERRLGDAEMELEIAKVDIASRETEIEELRELCESFYEVINSAISSGDWKVDGACDPDIDLKHFEEIKELHGW